MSQVVDRVFGLGAMALLLGAAGLALRGGLLVEPVTMEVLGACGPRCSEVRCVMENQGPLRALGQVVIDAWQGDYEDGTARQIVDLDLRPGERAEVVRQVPGLPYARGKTMVRCMPWYAAGRRRPARR